MRSVLQVAVFCVGLAGARAGDAPLVLARDGMTRYAVVLPDNATMVDAYAIRMLTNGLHQATGAEFPVVSAREWKVGSPAIIVGMSAPAREALGPDPLEGLQDEEHVSRSRDGNIFLHGRGGRGNLYAVMEFLETALGWRWFTVFDRPIIPRQSVLTLAPFHRKRGFSFLYRDIAPSFTDAFYYLQGVNSTWKWQRNHAQWERLQAQGILPVWEGKAWLFGCHSLFSLIPPRPDLVQFPIPWIATTNYFETNPEYFTLNEGGVRVPGRQLCFSSRGLRDALTATVLEQIRRADGCTVATVGAEDSGGRFCHCASCRQLDERYDVPSGGAYFDYLLELCGVVQERYPEARIKGMAYRRNQSQKPPVLPEGQRFPDNFIILFAPINDSYLGDWSQPDPDLQETYRDLLDWCRITSHQVIFYYPNPYGTGQVMPLGNVQRLVTAMRLAHAAGVEGFYLEHGSGVIEGGNFTELLAYLCLHLMRDIHADTAALIREFTDAQYGLAGALVRRYLDELERGRLAIKVMPRAISGFSSRTYDSGNWPYLTPENLRRWQGYFDTMETQCAEDPTALANVQRLRRNLDFATLFCWHDLVKAHPDYFSDSAVHSARIQAVNAAKREDLAFAPRPMAARTVQLLESVIRGGGEKPLPAQFDGVDPARIRTMMPIMEANNEHHQGHFEDPEAAFGYAPTVHLPDLPFTCGFYQSDTKKRIVDLSLTLDDITPGVYRLHRLGEITLSPRSQIWFSVRSWSTKVVLDDLWEPGDPNRWDAYLSMKFEGPRYGGTPVEGLRAGEVDRVLVDRVILVKKESTEIH